MIPYGRQQITEADVEAVAQVLRSDFLTQGPAVPAFEEAVARRCGAAHAVAVCNATAALHVACLALGVGPGDHVWTSPVTFLASANCALYCGAQVDFVDIDLQTGNICCERLEEKLELAQRAGCLPKVVIPVHLAGLPCNMPRIHELSRRFGFRIIEDASHAIGASYGDHPVGSCHHSDIVVFSFHPVKIITSGEGGMALTQDAALAHSMRLLRSHGMEREAGRLQTPSAGPWYYEQQVLGFNYRLTDLQAALGLSQLARLDTFVAAREAIAHRYDAMLADLPVTRPQWRLAGRSALHLYVIRLQSERIRSTHREVFESLRDAGVGVNLHYIPVYLQPYYRGLGFQPGLCQQAERYYREAISLPIYADFSVQQQEFVVAELRRALHQTQSFEAGHE